MRKLAFEEFKNYEYQILVFFDKVCSDNGIKYYLAYGTALGAVRHGGFIPWDDDIDVVMFRDDYLKFEKIMSEKRNTYYRLLSLKLEKKYDYPFPKLTDTRTILVREKYRSKVSIGVYIDLFILDKIPMDKKKRNSIYKKLSFFTILWDLSERNIKLNQNNLMKFIKYLPFKLISPRKISQILDKTARKYNNSDSTLYRKLTYFIDDEPPATRQVFGKGKRIKFEDGEFPVPDDVDFYLKGRYGDYMKLPPIEKRTPNHDNIAYIKE